MLPDWGVEGAVCRRDPVNAGAHDVKECSMREGCYSERWKVLRKMENGD